MHMRRQRETDGPHTWPEEGLLVQGSAMQCAGTAAANTYVHSLGRSRVQAGPAGARQ